MFYYIDTGPTILNRGSSASGYIRMTNATQVGVNAVLYFSPVIDNTVPATVMFQTVSQDTYTTGGGSLSGGSITGLEVYATGGGSITVGTMRIYGIKNS